mmetsp:Transcript_139807/g.257382  ORF Transcript_139807/g.257382 Transcript_139807/m.257382 type:complete len:723 (+) Transcript_139807:78-2246(+)
MTGLVAKAPPINGFNAALGTGGGSSRTGASFDFNCESPAPYSESEGSALPSVASGARRSASSAPATLAGILGTSGLSLATPGPARPASGSSASGEASAPVVAQVLKVIATLQAQLQENEVTIADLQAEADAMEEKCRTWRRRAERAEHDRAEAAQRRDDAEAAAKRARAAAAPLVERFMEAEVLRTQIQASKEEADRLCDEIDTHHEEIKRESSRLAESEDMDAECKATISQMEAAHTAEISMLRSCHCEEMAEIRGLHSTRRAEIETARLDEISALKTGHSEDLSKLRSAIEAARWQSEVYIREQQDAVREVCLRQRENARLAKRHNEARQEALELAVKLEAMRAAEAGAPAREAELHVVRQRCMLLQRTADEWRQALENKNADCDRWRKRAAQRRGGTLSEGEIEEDVESARPASPVSVTSTNAGGMGSISAQVPTLDWSAMSNSLPTTPGARARNPGLWSSVPTPTRTPHQAPGHSGRSTPSAGHHQASQQQQQQLRRHSSAPSGRLPNLPQYNGAPPRPRRDPREWDYRENRLALAAETAVSWDNNSSGLYLPMPVEAAAESPPGASYASASSVMQEQAVDSGMQEYTADAEDLQPSEELVQAALQAAHLWQEAARAGVAPVPGYGGSRGHSPDTAAGDLSGGGRLARSALNRGMGSRSELSQSLQEAENEVEMLMFLLDDSSVHEAAVLLEMEARRHLSADVARKLREYAAELKRKS